MAFCKFSPEYTEKSYTIIDNLFFSRYIPSTPPELSNIYLFGLYLCSNKDADDLDLQGFANALGVTTSEIVDAYEYWQELDLVRIISKEPFQIQYLPIKNVTRATRKFSVGKYDDFNRQLQDIFPNRQITPNEFDEYYSLLEGFTLTDGRRMQTDALLAIIKYCVNLRGDKINYKYIIPVARNWANDGIITLDNIEAHIAALSASNQNMRDVLHALGTRKSSTLNDQQLYLKWTQELGFEPGTVLEIAHYHRGKSLESFDTILHTYYRNHLFTLKDITHYENNKDNMYKLARLINKNIGVYYESLESEINTYIIPWLNIGFTPDCLDAISKYCFQHNYRTLKQLADFINKLHHLGILSTIAFEQYIFDISKVDTSITEVLNACGLHRSVNNQDRELYSRWIHMWNMPHEVVMYAASLSIDKTSPLSYVSKILANWHTANVHNLESAKKQSANNTPSDSTAKLNQRDYSQDDWDNLFDSIKQIEI